MKILIVGAGVTGATIAAITAEQGHYVKVIDKKGHVAENCFDYMDETGLWIQQYGPHIFHTKNQKVWDFLNRFIKFNDYIHRVKVREDDKYITMPINLDTLESLYNEAV
ncbi:MAG: NAD(P)-binding protein [bacterium]